MAESAPIAPAINPEKDSAHEALLNEKAADLSISDPPATESTPAPVTDTTEVTAASASTDAVPPPAVAVEEPVVAAETPREKAPVYTQEQLAPTGVTKLPIPGPLATSKPLETPKLTETEVTKYEELLAIVSGWTAVPKTSVAGSEEEPVTDDDKIFLTKEQLLRYLRATKWDVPSAGKRLLATLTWRREYGINAFTHDYISPENETGKQVIQGYDNESRPCLYLNPSKQNTERSDKQLQHLFYNMERVIDLMGPGQESLVLLINFMDTRKGQGATIAQSRMTLYVLQNHYPERLGRALITDLPWYISAFFKMISPFIDPHTKTKLKFNEPMTNFVPPEQLLTNFGGKLEFEYEHATYWPALDALCSRRRKDYVARWEKAGKQIGESETYLKGGEEKSLNGEHTGTDFLEGFASST
jgi:hypothetical protein